MWDPSWSPPTSAIAVERRDPLADEIDRDPDDGRHWIYVPRRPAIELVPVLVDLMIRGIENTAVDVPPEQAGAAEHRDAF